jgi:uncharacterized membrane protein YdjX (TVP38/TMEM64 family)
MADNPENPAPLPRKKAWKDLLRLALVAAFFVAAGILLNNSAVQAQLFDIDTMRAEVQGSGVRGLLIFMGVAAMVNALGIPRLWICAVAGSLFGAVDGTLIGLGTTLVGASLNFLMGRSLLRGPIKRHMPQRLRRWYKAFNRNGFRAILYMRLFPGANATLTSLIGGASHMRYRDYLLASFIGFLPFTIVFATLGSSAAKQNKWQLAGGLLLFAAVAAAQWAVSRGRKKLDMATEDPVEADAPAVTGKVDI